MDKHAWWFIALERCCHSQLMAEVAGKPIILEPEIARFTYNQVGSHIIGWFSFQSLYDMILNQQPDLLESSSIGNSPN